MSVHHQLCVQAEQTVEVTVLGSPPSTFTGRIKDYSGRGMLLRMDRMLDPGTAVKLEWDKVLLLAEVTHCASTGDSFEAGLHLDNVVFDTEDLARLARRLLEDAPPR